ncbi:MAG: hypothetical protein KKC18_00800, partial [Chloroflexi bacterium]|nr:hypothetical protein [Chloroflexota bacterium]
SLLGLGPETDGVLARYSVGGAVAQLLLVQYPDAETASARLAALRQAQGIALEGSQVDGLAAAKARDNLLGAAFGEVDEAAAGTLLSEALGNQ